MNPVPQELWAAPLTKVKRELSEGFVEKWGLGAVGKQQALVPSRATWKGPASGLGSKGQQRLCSLGNHNAILELGAWVGNLAKLTQVLRAGAGSFHAH